MSSMFDIGSLFSKINKDFDSALEWRSYYEYVRYLLWDATEILLTHDSLYQAKGLQRLNLRSVEHLEKICQLFTERKIDETQAINCIGEWIGILLAKEPGYFTVIEEILVKTYKTKEPKRTDNLFLNIFCDGYFVNWAWGRYNRQSQAQSQDRQATKGIIDDYINVRQQTGDNLPSAVKKGPKFINCLLSQNQLKSLHQQLISAGYMETSTLFSQFKIIFSEELSPFTDPIRWLKKTNSLGFLFYELDDNQQRISGKWQALLGDVNKVFSIKGKVVSTTNYSSIASNLRSKGKINAEQQLIKSIIQNILTIKE